MYRKACSFTASQHQRRRAFVNENNIKIEGKAEQPQSKRQAPHVFTVEGQTYSFCVNMISQYIVKFYTTVEFAF